jgi:hypothetical protein
MAPFDLRKVVAATQRRKGAKSQGSRFLGSFARHRDRIMQREEKPGQIPMILFCHDSVCSLRSLTCERVKIPPRQWMVGPSSDSRLWLGETPAGASSAVNVRACRILERARRGLVSRASQRAGRNITRKLPPRKWLLSETSERHIRNSRIPTEWTKALMTGG